MILSNTDETNKRTHNSLKFEGALGLGLARVASFEIKTDHRTSERSYVGCFSRGISTGEAYGTTTFNNNVDGEVTSSYNFTGGAYVNGFIGAGALAAKVEYNLFTDKFESKYGLSQNNGIIGIGLGADISLEGCLEVNPSGLFRSAKELIENYFKDRDDSLVKDDESFDIEKSNYHTKELDFQNRSSLGDLKDSIGERNRSDMGTLSDRPIDDRRNRYDGD